MAGDQVTDVRRLFAAYAPGARAAGATLPPMDLTLAPAMENDVAGIARLMHERDAVALDVAEERTRQWVETPRGERLLLVARADGQVAGYGRVLRIEGTASADGAEPPPAGWYLMGVIVDPAIRRRGIGLALTRERLRWIALRSREAFFFANSINRASIDLHNRVGFKEVRRDFEFPGATFNGGGIGILFRVDLSAGVPPA
jgi:ribosomal protein S18 acetylase RimI-like enzyme